MPEPRPFRLSALLAAMAVIAASLLPAFPAAAEEPPAAEPAATSTPTPEATPVETPAAPPTTEPTAAPSGEPTTTPMPSETALAVPVAPDAVQYSGSINEIANEDGADGGPSYPLLNVAGLGFLRVDTSGLSAAVLSGSIELTLAVPEGLSLADSPATRFTQLANHAATVAPLVAIDSAPYKQTAPRETSSAVNQTPSAPATHKIYAVLVSPNSLAMASNQTSSEVVSLVNYANTYWSNQSDGDILFSLVGTAPWYSTSYSCKTQAGNTALWNQAAAVAKSKLGYVAGKNAHLVLILPKTANCGGAIGLATVGGSVNAGGLVWVVGGATAQVRKATLVHELGHNLSLGHADWLECGSSNPPVGQSNVNPETDNELSSIDDCITNYYGDILDVMGYGIDYAAAPVDGGALSSPNAIRAGIWPSSAWTNAAVGDHQYVLSPVGQHSGLRSVVVQDDDGTNYFVEYRTYAGDDADLAPWDGCQSTDQADGGGICAESGIRILRFEPSWYVGSEGNLPGYQGLPGYDSFLIGATNMFGIDHTIHSTGTEYQTERGTIIRVNSMNGTTASVQVIRATHAITAANVAIRRTIGYDDLRRVGDTVTAFLGDQWDADSYSFQWKNDGVDIDGATAQSYVLAPADLGHTVTVTVTGHLAGESDQSVTSPGYSSIVAGVPTGSGAAVILPSTLKIGLPLTADDTLVLSDLNGPIAEPYVSSYQWYRNGVAIPLAMAQSYTMQPADYGQKVTVRVKLDSPGYQTFTSAASAAVIPNIKGTIQGNFAIPTMVKTINATDFTLTATLPVGSVTEPGVTIKYQWYRVSRTTSAEAAIPGATLQTYKPVAANYPYKLRVAVFVSKLNYNAIPSLKAASKDYALRLDPLLASGSSQVGLLINHGNVNFKAENDATGVVEDLGTAVQTGATQWLRNGIVMDSGWFHELVALDLGKSITFRVAGAKDGYLAAPVTTSPAVIAKVGTFAGTRALPTVTQGAGTLVLTASGDPSAAVPAGSVDPTLPVITYQWYRNGVAITGAKSVTYTLNQALDFGKTIDVAAIYTKPAYTNVVLHSAPVKYSIGASPSVPVISGPQTVGHMLQADDQVYRDLRSGGVITPTPTYQWYRNGIAIAGGVGKQYTVQSLDAGKLLTVRVTAAQSELLTSSTLSAATQVIGANRLQHWDSPVVVLPAPTSMPFAPILQVTDVETVGPPPVVTTYQWLRDGVAITGAIKATYAPTAADNGHLISARVTSSKAPTAEGTWTRVVKVSDAKSYTITSPGGGAVVPGTTPKVGDELQFSVPTYATVMGSLDIPDRTPKIQWLRNGVAITGATFGNYVVKAADVGARISARLTMAANAGGYVPNVQTFTLSPATAMVAKGTLIGTGTVPTVFVSIPPTNTLQAVPPVVTGSAASGSPSALFAYQWLRNGTAISLATASTYKLSSLDSGKSISVRVTAILSGYNSVVLPLSTPVNYSITSNGQKPTIAGNRFAGQILHAIPPPFFESDGVTPITATLTYTWYRSGVIIPGALAADYTLTGLDVGKLIGVKVTATFPGRIGLSSPPSDKTTAIGIGSIAVGSYAPNVAVSAAGKATVTMTGTPTTPVVPFTFVYRWYRNAIAITGATLSSYTLNPADTAKDVTVIVTIGKSGFTSHPFAPIHVNVIGTAGPPVITGGFAYYDLLECDPPAYYLASGVLVVDDGDAGDNGTITYAWSRNGVPISGATLPTYTVDPADENSSLVCTVSAAAPLHKTFVESSAPHLIPS